MGEIEAARFEITLCWKSRGGFNLGSRVFTKKVILPVKSSRKINGESEHELVRVICTRSKEGRVKEIHNWKQVKGAVAFSKEAYDKDVNVIVNELEEKGSVAAFVLVKPTVTTTIPVFVLSPAEFEQVLEFEPKLTKIRVKRIPLHPIELSNNESLVEGGKSKRLEPDGKAEELEGVEVSIFIPS